MIATRVLEGAFPGLLHRRKMDPSSFTVNYKVVLVSAGGNASEAHSGISDWRSFLTPISWTRNSALALMLPFRRLRKAFVILFRAAASSATTQPISPCFIRKHPPSSLIACTISNAVLVVGFNHEMISNITRVLLLLCLHLPSSVQYIDRSWDNNCFTTLTNSFVFRGCLQNPSLQTQMSYQPTKPIRLLAES